MTPTKPVGKSGTTAAGIVLALDFLERQPAAAARVLEGHPPEAGVGLLAQLPVSHLIPLLRCMMPAYVTRHLEVLPDERAVALLRLLDNVEAAAILRSLPPARCTTLLRRLPQHQSLALDWLLEHPGDRVGAWADAKALTLPPDITAKEALQRLRQAESEPDETLYVINRERQLVGQVRVTALLQLPATTLVSGVMRPSPPRLQAQARLDTARGLPAWRTHAALPIVDRQQRFVGVLRREDLDRGLDADRGAVPETSLTDTLLAAGTTYWLGLSNMLSASIALAASALGEATPRRRGGSP